MLIKDYKILITTKKKRLANIIRSLFPTTSSTRIVRMPFVFEKKNLLSYSSSLSLHTSTDLSFLVLPQSEGRTRRLWEGGCIARVRNLSFRLTTCNSFWIPEKKDISIAGIENRNDYKYFR